MDAVKGSNESGPAILLRLGRVTAIGWAAFQLYTAAFGFFPGMIQLPIHIAFAMALAFCRFSGTKSLPKGRIYLVDLPLYVLSLAIGLYVLLSYNRIIARIPFVDELTWLDLFFGASLVLVLLEVCRRTVGLALTVIVIVFIAYAFLGPWIPGDLNHRGISLTRFIDLQFLSPNAIFSLPSQVSAEVVFYFILFGAFLEKSGGGQLFINIAYMVTGRLRGGAAKASVISSALFGTISGSAVANVVVDGIFTIPLMKKTGFRPAFASAVEASASTGGQIMPPVMGAAAFIMAQLLGVPYSHVMVAAIIPAVLYYASLYLMVDFQARKDGIKAIPGRELPNVREEFWQRSHLLIPLIFLVSAILAGYAIFTAAFWSIIVTVVTSFARTATRMNRKQILQAMESGAKEAVMVAIPCAMAGILIGVVVHTGLGLKLTRLVVTLSQDQFLLALCLIMIACLILGMGMPTSAAYLIAVVLLAPALIKMGMLPLAAHMFIFYFAVISMVTPPVALAAYAAAAIGEASMWKTGWEALKISLAGFLIPFAFAYNPALLLQGPIGETLWVTVTAFLGTSVLAAAVIGYYRTRVSLWERALLAIAGVCLISPEKISDFVGLGIMILLFFRPWEKKAAVST